MATELEYDLNLETCIRCTELAYNVADGLGDDLRAELALLRALRADAYSFARTLPTHRVWTPEEAALAAHSAELDRLTMMRGDLAGE